MLFTSPSLSLWLCAVVMLSTGCTSTGLKLDFMAEKHQKEAADNPVEQIIPVWREAEGPGIKNGIVSRGFAGQIYFITQNRGLPSEIKGDIRIYVFDNQGEPEEQAKPIHQFDYNASTWNEHLSMSKLGPAYSVFVPYTRPGHNTAECAVRIRYTPANGGTPVFSQMVAITLAGPKQAPQITEPAEKITSPTLSKREAAGLRKVTQVSASGELIDQKRVQTAAYEAPAKQKRTSGKVRLSGHRQDSLSAREAFLGADIVDLPSDEESVEEILFDEPESDSPELTDATEVPQPSDEADSNQTVKTYTIPLE